jgi:primosomal protein N' (replication factor Y) (superfamily II helicase)
MQRTFADVVLPLAIPRTLTYEVLPDLLSTVQPGKRVIVQVGKHKIYSGLVRRIHNNIPLYSDIKDIQSVLDDEPVVNERQFQLWEWIAEYYMCSIGEVMNCALPASLKLQSETTIILNPDYPHTQESLTDKEYIIYEALLIRHNLSLLECAKILMRKSAHTILKGMIEKGVVLVAEEMEDKYKAKREVRVHLSANYSDDKNLQQVFTELEKRSPKQLETLMAFIKLLYENPERNFVKRLDLIPHKSVSASALSSLLKKKILEEEVVIVDRLKQDEKELHPPHALSVLQQQSLEEVKKNFEEHHVVLLHGVTSSGKTELYIHLIEETLKQGKQVLYLLPEIALTTQMIHRLRKHFGNAVGVYHSRFNSNERVEIWKKVLASPTPPKEGLSNAQSSAGSAMETPPSGGRGAIILGARSALFLPYSNIGLIIIDEEHDPSYKQNEITPRYHARDSALVLARIHGAKTLMGSATPSLESYFNAEEKKYGLVKMHERFGGMEMPEIIISDVQEAVRRRQMKSHFTPTLMNAVGDALTNKEQIILFQNRRGFAPVLECNNCSWIPHCKNCTVTLTYHKGAAQLKCHYCGYSQNPPSVCEQCGDTHLTVKGFGTEKIEEEISLLFPDVKAARLDLDATRTKHAFQNIINEFEDRKINVLVGTQMVTKGLDFENVTTVGIINADQMLNFPDFRAHERSFQLMEQVSGRSGRRQKRGKVIIQTHQPQHWLIDSVVRHDYESFYRHDLAERKKFLYPPHTRLIEITLKHKDAEFLHESSFLFADMLRAQLGKRILGPHQPVIAKIRNLWLKNILIKIEREASSSKVKEIIRSAWTQFQTDKNHRSILIAIDVDPH